MLLPSDIIVDILTRVPAKSLLRFRCVSKGFISLIDGKDFIYRHVNRSIETNSNLNLVVSLFTMKPEKSIHSLSLDSLDSCVEVAHQFEKFMPHVMGSCNGLLALQDDCDNTILLNPFTKKHLELPNFHHGLVSATCFDGFGYDVGSDDYKLVKIAVSNFGVRSYAEVTVYSLKNNSCRKIKDFPYRFCLDGAFGAFVNGALHWLAHLSPERFRDDLMIAFDSKSEEFYQVPMPPLTVGNNRATFYGVDVLGGCLSSTCRYGTGTEMAWHVFVMKDYGVKESWTKLFTLTEGVIGYYDYIKALAYSRSGDKVLVVADDGSLYWYDLEMQRVESGIQIDVQGMTYCDNCIVCVDGLVSLDAYLGNRIDD